MKRLFLLMIPAALLIAACNSSSNNAEVAATSGKQEAAVVTGDQLKVDTTASRILWTGKKQTGKHEGELPITDGVISVNEGQVTGGSFTINIAAIEVNDLEGKDKAKLEGHLKSPDFFEVQKYPSAKFEITSVTPADDKVTGNYPGATHVISGNLTLKDSTKNVTFPAKVEANGEGVGAQADFTIDRTNWGLNYKGPNNPQDWFIKKEVELKLNLVAKK